jgi:hypothetical protein
LLKGLKRGRLISAKELLSFMGHSKTKAGKLLGSISELTVKEWDQLLTELGREWMRAFANRQVQAHVEGVNTPPPDPPTVPGSRVAEPTPAKRADTAVLGTVRDLVDHYKTDEASTYRTLRFQTREHYDGQIKRILEQLGDLKLEALDADGIQAMRDAWSAGNKGVMANSLISILRIIINFGANVLHDKECERLAGAIMRIKTNDPPSNKTRITEAQANAVRAAAHRKGRPSIALAQALQFDCKLQQKDVIGEWVPLSENGSSDIIAFDKKWVSGIRWNQIDSNLILTHTASRNGKEIRLDLRTYPMVVEELNKIGTLPTTGPVIRSEASGDPWVTGEFRRWWRICARAAGIPDGVNNGDSTARDESSAPSHKKASES